MECNGVTRINNIYFNSKTALFPTNWTPLDTTLAAGRVVSVTLESCMVGGAGDDINENKSQPEPSLRLRKRPDRVIQPSKSPAP